MILRWLVVFSLFCVKLFSLAPPAKPADWDNWKYNQKVIWRGVNLDPRIPYGPLVDKLVVKDIVKDHIPTAKVVFATNDPSEINIENLPKTFLMKANNGSYRGILVKDGIVITDKKRCGNFVPIPCTNDFLRSYAVQWLQEPYEVHREMQYGLVKPMIFFEEVLEDFSKDVELFFFNGKVRLIAVRFNEDYTKQPKIAYYDEHWNLLNVPHRKLEMNRVPIEKPHYLDRLIAFGELFAEKIDHVRIDFFEANNDVYFGEFTFTTCSGTGIDYLNEMIGNYWDYPEPDDSLDNPFLNELLRNAGF